MACRGLALFLALLVMVLALPRAARADQPGPHTVPVAVLAFDSEDSEEQADALTAALRSRIRSAPGWSLIETTQSLGMLTAALKCPSRPTPECQQKIAEQIKAERYIWGFVAKGPQQGQVTAEIHLYQKGKADTVLRESYADNLKDGNDDTLRKIAGRIVERLGGTAVGVVVVRAGEAGDIVVDGDKRVPLKEGTARIELAAGGHSIELSAASGTSTKRNVLVTAGRETVVEFTAAATPGTPEPGSERPFPTRKVIGGATMALGVGLGVLGFVSLANYLSAESDGEARAKEVPRPEEANPPQPPGTPCREYDTASKDSCKFYDEEMKKASAIGLVAGGVSVVALTVGAVLLFGGGDSGGDKAATTAEKQKPKARVVPTAGAGTGGLMVVGSF